MADSENKQDPQGQSSQQPPAAPAQPANDGQGKQSEPKTDVPSNLQGKSAEELAKMYASLEKKLGEQSGEVAKSREEVKKAQELTDKMGVVLEAIYSDPKLLKEVESQIGSLYGNPQNQPQNQNTQQLPQKDDVRRTLENQIMTGFRSKYGIDQLPPEKQKEMNEKIGVAFAEMLDPKGAKPYSQIIAEVPLDKLPHFLENAYYLANKDQLLERSRLEGQVSYRQNEAAAFGSFPSSSARSEDLQLSPLQKETARKMGVSEEKYLQRLKEINKVQA